MKQVLFTGAIFRDLVTVTPRFPKEGETLVGEDFFTGFGGKTSNAAVMCARLGGEVSYLGALGEDENGKAYIENYKNVGVDCKHVKLVSGRPSGIASIYVNSKTGENKIVVVKGANEAVTPADMKPELFAPFSTVVCSLEMDRAAVEAAFDVASSHGALRILNAAPAWPDLESVIRKADVLCVNEDEAATISHLSTESGLTPICAKLLEMCPSIVVTLGSKGAMFATRDNPTPSYVAADSVAQVVDTTGAGDAFVGSLVFFLTYHPEVGLEGAVLRASKIASISVQTRGTQSSYPYPKDLPAGTVPS